MENEFKIKAKKNKTRRTGSEKVLFTIMFILMFLLGASYIIGFIITIINSFKDPMDYALGNTYKLPGALYGWHPENFLSVFSTLKVNGVGFLPMFWNSAWQTLGPGLLSIISTVMASYAYARFKFHGRKVIFFIVVVLLTISLPGSIPATYKLYTDLHMRNSYLFLIGSTAGFGSSFLIFMGLWRGVSWSYAEAAYIDGANEWQVFYKIMLPHALPMMGVSLISAFTSGWLSENPSMLYLPDMPSLGYGLYMYQAKSARGMNFPVFYAALIIVAIPSIVTFLLLHEKTIKIMNLGGLKG